MIDSTKTGRKIPQSWIRNKEYNYQDNDRDSDSEFCSEIHITTQMSLARFTLCSSADLSPESERLVDSSKNLLSDNVATNHM